MTLILAALSDFFKSGDISSVESSAEDAFVGLCSIVTGVSYLASWVLMIIARAKYRRSVFAKVVMWIYIVLLILGVIATVVLIMTCVNMIRQCPG
jgi:hypothetical protein